jgi:hypothetical protein
LVLPVSAVVRRANVALAPENTSGTSNKGIAVNVSGDAESPTLNVNPAE